MKVIYFILLCLLPVAATAHVKWFSQYGFEHPPLNLSDFNHPAFWGLFLLTVGSFPLLVYLDQLSERWPVYTRLNSFLDKYSDKATLILRVATGASLLLSWQLDAMVAPEIAVSSPIWGWFQFALVLLLLTKETTPIAGLGMIILWLVALFDHGLFHLLDYIVYPAVGYFLLVANARRESIRDSSTPVLYAGLGFSLCWVALEKMFYPNWGLEILNQVPALTMGLDPKFFLLACAFVEIALGYLLIICLLHRPLALVITLVFFTTTAFFGKTEIVGHTLLHGALLVFVVRGAGRYYLPPIRFHKNLGLRMAFASVNFVVLFALLAPLYSWMAHSLQQQRSAQTLPPAVIELHGTENLPQVDLQATKDPNGGWNLHLVTENFRFAPESSGEADRLGEGHAHLYVNGAKEARVYGPWFHLVVPEGQHQVTVTLNSNSHRDYVVDGQPIVAEVTIDEDRESGGAHAH